ncbi:peptide chain release factor 2 [Patescibacteria group bacterium]
MKNSKSFKRKSSIWRTVFDLDEKRKRIKELEKNVQNPDLWKNREDAVSKNQELSNLKEEVSRIDELKKELEQLETFSKEEKGWAKEIEDLKKKIEKEEVTGFLSGKYDRNPALFSIFAGAGGQDSQDWTTMLLRMYERFCQRRGLRAKILHQSFGEGGGPDGRIGTKSVTLRIEGNLAYGILKKETGVHRLVRISPFSPKKLRHTSFALVEILPELEIDSEIDIRPEDIRVDMYRASGPGGQYVNKRESAVRITHLPTKIVVSCQSERLQGKNKEMAMKQLYSKLHKAKEAENKEELSQVKGKSVSASWGNQIRSYVLHPYKLVKDLRTNIETSNVESVLDGNLDEFIEAEIQHD